MNNSGQEKQDQRTNSGMEDSTAMTIEFLRARLLSERSVSRSARQRADELAKRVAELEEQLRIVSLQRLKAEQATEDVLAILEGNGISDISGTFDSSSDQDTHRESKVGNMSFKEEENSINSKVRNNESEELSGSDLDFSSVHGRSLSWKACKDSSRSLEKYKDPSMRRRNSFTSVGSLPKQRPGKSCRQIRRKESRSVNEEYKGKPVKDNSVEDEIATSESFPNCSVLGTKGSEEKMLLKDSHSDCLENEQSASDTGLDYNVCGGDREMKKALEHQAQLIGQYEAMEKAQREWEEKFRENNNSTPDSCDPGNRSDVTEERYEIRVPNVEPAMRNAFQTREVRSEAEDISKIEANGFLSSSHVDEVCLEERKSTTTPVSESSTQEFAFPMAKGRQNQEGLGNNYQSSSHIPRHESASIGLQSSLEGHSTPNFPSNVSNIFRGKEASENENERYALVPHKVSDGLGGVLEALKEARQSLQQRIDRLPLVATTVGKFVETSVPSPPTIPGDKVQIPVGCVGLFRLPTDFSVESNARAYLLNSSPQSSLQNHYSDIGFPAAASNRFVSSPYLQIRPRLPTEDQFLASQYVQGGSGIPPLKPYFDPYLDTGLPSSSRYTYPNYPINTSYPDLMPRMPTREAFLPSARTVGIPTSNHFSFIDDNTRPNMYR